MRLAKNQTRFEPKLEIGSTVTVPLGWPALALDMLDPEIANIFQQRLWMRKPGFFTVQRNGKDFEDIPPELPARRNERDSQLHGLVLPNLPTGNYVIRIRSSDHIGSSIISRIKPEHGRGGWKESLVSFEVTANSAAEFTAPILRIEASR